MVKTLERRGALKRQQLQIGGFTVCNTHTAATADSLEDYISMQVGEGQLRSVSLEYFSKQSPRTSPSVQHHAVMKIDRECQPAMSIHIECRPLDEAHYISRSTGFTDPTVGNEYWVTMNTLAETWGFIVSLCDRLSVKDVHCSMMICRTMQSTIQYEWLDRQVQWCQSNTPPTHQIRLALIERTLGTSSLMMECLSEQSKTLSRSFLDINTATDCPRSHIPRTSHYRRTGQVPQLFIVCHSFEEAWHLSCLIANAINASTMTLEQVPDQ